MIEELQDNQAEVLPPLPKGYEPVKKSNSTVPPLPSGYNVISQPKTTETKQEPAPIYRGIANSLPTMNVGKATGDIASLPQAKVAPLGNTDLQQKMKVREEDKDLAVKNYISKKGIKENTPQYQKEVENVNKQLFDDNLTVSTNKNGEKQLFRTENFGQTLWNTLKSSVKSSADALKENNASDAELLDIYRQKDAEPDSETRPSGVSGYFAELAGGIVKPIALQSLNAIMPTLGTSAMVAEAYNTARANQTYQLYREGVKQGLAPEQALAKAKNTAQYSALGDAASMYALSGALGSVENKAVETAAKTFKQSLKDGAKGVLKVGGIIGAAEGSKVPIEAAGGYDRTVTEGIEKTLEGVGSGIMMDLAFKTAAHAITNPLGVPKAMFAAAKNLISEAPKELVDAHIEAMPEEVGSKVKESIDNFQKAKEKVNGFVPEDDVAWFAGRMEKADNHEKEIVQLELSKVGKPKFVQDQIDGQIGEIRDKVDQINREVEKAYKSGKKPIEKDDVTGLKLGEEPSVTVIKPEENQPKETIGIGVEEIKPETQKSGVSVVLPSQNRKPNIIEKITEEPIITEQEIKTPQVEEQAVEVLQPTKIETNPIKEVSEAIKPTEKGEKIEPIKQLGTGANVYFESKKYRVNDDTKEGKVLLNIGDENSEVPLANIGFNSTKEAVYVAKKLEENAPQGLTSGFHDINKIVDNFKEEYKKEQQTPIKYPKPFKAKDSDALIHYGEVGDKRGNKGQPLEVLEEIPISDLKLDEFADINRDNVDKYSKLDTEIPPIEVHRDEDGNLVYDGNTRVLAAKKKGQKTIKAWVSTVGEDGTFIESKENYNKKQTPIKEEVKVKQTEQPIVEQSTPTVKEEGLKDVESTAKALEDKYYENKGIGKQNQLDIIDLIPKEQLDNPNENGFYRVSKMDDDWVSKQPKQSQENIKKLNDLFKDKQKEQVIAEAYHKAKADGSNPELVKAVEELLGKKETPKEEVKVETPVSESQKEINRENELKENSSKVGDVKWNNQRTAFSDKNGKKYFSDKNGNEYELKEAYNKFNNDLTVYAYDKNGSEISMVSFKKRNGVWVAEESFTNEQNRKNKVSTALYDYVNSKYGEIKPSEKLTNDGLKFWEKNKSTPKQEIKIEEVKPTDEFISKNGKHKIVYDEKGNPKVVDTKTGEKASDYMTKKVINEKADSFDYSKGKRIEEEDLEGKQFKDEEELEAAYWGEHKATNGFTKESSDTKVKQTEAKVEKKASEANKSLADKLREVANGIKENGVLPDYLKATLPDGTKQAGFSEKGVNETIAKALNKLADVLEKTDDIKAAIEEAWNVVKDYYDKNTLKYNEQKVRSEFDKVVRNFTGEGAAKESTTVIEPPFTLVKRELVKARERVGLGEFDKETVTDEKAIKDAETAIKEWKEKGTYQKEIENIIDKANRKEISDLGNNVLAQHIADLETAGKKMDRFSKEYDKNRAELKKAIDAGDKIRSEAGRILGRDIQVFGKEPESVQDIEMEMMQDNEQDILTDEQKREAEKRFNEFKEVADREAKLRVEAEAEIERLKAELEIAKAKKAASGNTKKTKGDYQAERKTIVESIKDKWKKAGNDGTLTAVPIPFVKPLSQKLSAIAPDVAKLLNSYISEFKERGIDITLEKARELLKKDINEAGIEVSDEDVRGLIAGKFNEKKETKSELVTKRQDLVTEEKLLLEIEAYENGEIPKTEGEKKAKIRKFTELRNKLADLKKAGLAKDIEEPKTNSERLQDAKDAVNERIAKIKEEILNKERELKEKEKPLNEDLELTRLREVEKEITALRDKYLPKPKDKFEVEKQRSGLKKSLYDSIIKLNEQINNGQRNKVEPKNKFENDEHINKLREIKKAKEDLLESIDPKLSDQAKLENAKQKAVDNIAELERKIAENDLSVKNNPKITDSELESYRVKQKKLRDELDQKRKDLKLGKYSDQAKFETVIKNQIALNKREQARIQDKINKKDYSEDVPKMKILDNTLLQKQNKKLYEEYQQAVIDKQEKLLELERKKIEDRKSKLNNWGKVKDGASYIVPTLQSTVAGFDQSMAFVQLIGYSWSHPINSLKFAKIALFNDLAQKKFFDKRMANLHGSYIFEVMQKSGLTVYEPRSANSELRHEMLGGDKNLWNKEFTVAGKKYSIGQALERSVVGWMNNARVDLFISQAEVLAEQGKTFENNPEEFKAAARAAMEWTAGGKIQKTVLSASPIVNKIIWSAKMMASTLNVLGFGDLVRGGEFAKQMGRDYFKMNIPESGKTKGFYASLTPTARKQMVKELGRFLGMTSAFIGAGIAMGVIKRFDANPFSPTFGYAFFDDKEESSLAVFGRYASMISGILRTITGIQYLFDKDKYQDIGERIGSKDVEDVLVGFAFRGKMTPSAGLLYDFFLKGGKNYYTHERIDAKYVAKSMAVPMSFQAAVKAAYSDEPLVKKMAKTFLQTYGMNISDKRNLMERKKNDMENRLEDRKEKIRKTLEKANKKP